MIYYTYHDTKIGEIRLRADDGGLLAVDHVNQQQVTEEEWVSDRCHPILQQATRELDEYFSATRRTFQVPLNPKGTKFQLQVWNALTTIPYGETATYSDIAQKIDNPKAVRAVGAANGKNPLSIFIPCHRVIGKQGKLVGYAGGVEVKKILLSLEIF